MKLSIIIFFVSFSLIGCTQDRGPGYRFDLFKNTPNWQLAQAVENEDVSLINKLVKEGKENIDLQEPEYKNTLLMLAVGNDKLVSTKVLLENGAKQSILDTFKMAPIHQATTDIRFKKNTVEILKLLLKYGGDPNQIQVNYQHPGDSLPYLYTPLMGAINDLSCTKLLLEHGANLYYKDGDEYPVWNNLLGFDLKPDDNIFVAKYLIVDKRMPIPNPIFYTIMPTRNSVDALTLLTRFRVYNDTEKQKAKDEILEYLKKIDFPNNGVYK